MIGDAGSGRYGATKSLQRYKGLLSVSGGPIWIRYNCLFRGGIMLGIETSVDSAVGQMLAVPAAQADGIHPYAGYLQAFFATSPAMELVSLCYVDGRPLATVGEAPPNHVARVAAMASSFLALSEAFAKEASHGRCSYATITSTQGLLVAVRVPSPKKLHVLCAAARRSDNLAMLLRRTLDCADSLATVLP